MGRLWRGFEILITFLFAITLIFFLPYFWNHFNPNYRYLSLGIFMMGGIVWLAARSRLKQPFYIPKIAIPICAFVVLQAVLLLVTPLPFTGLYWVFIGGMFLSALLLITDTLLNHGRVDVWEKALIVVGVFFALLDLLIILGWHWLWSRISGSIFDLPPIPIRTPGYFLGHPNFLAAYLNLILPLTVIRLIRQHKKTLQVVWLATLLLLLTVQFLTSSRGGWLAMVASLSVTLILKFYPDLQTLLRKRKPLLAGHKMRKFVLVGLLIGMAIGILAPLLASQLRLIGHGSFSDRVALWKYAIELIKSSPIWGYGPGSVPFFYALRSDAIGGDEVFHAHNVMLQVALVSGLLGLLIVLWAVAIALRAATSAWQNASGHSPQRDALVAYTGLMVGVGVHNMLDFLFWQPIFVMVVFTVLALMHREASKEAFYPLKKAIAIPAIASLLMVSAAGTLYILRGASSYEEGRVAAEDGDWMYARGKICQAYASNPSYTFYAFQCSLANAQVAFLQNDRQALQTAADLSTSALETDPFWYIHWANLASYEWELGNQAQAIEHLQRAVDAAPKKSFLWVNLGYMEEATRNLEAALQHYHIAVCQNPWLMETPLLSQSPFRSQVRAEGCPEAYDTLGKSRDQRLLWEGYLALKAGDVTKAEELLEQARQANPRNALAYAYLGWACQKAGKVEQAWLDAQTAVFIPNPSPRTLLVAAQVARSQGRDSQALNYIATAFDRAINAYNSQFFYEQAYRARNLTTDLSPFLVQSGLTPEFRELYLFWAKSLTQSGKAEQARKVIEWVELSIPPP